ncbi:MAG: hypothetical protein II382_07500 [Oscillospiraceae bacterium]|nr:hypothetical protein [Oscillospiraceae bacterium]MBQ1589360.1 hypothetical protein [Oscillospiraceae bacterium]MBQ2145000.1 hypothetical protein [Oscillospiraceae bacterium]MBQ2329022.1 hypothetical protein [Oscillospiraceae bacterium]MBQ4302490.1 hypothetical protein [Oscillospiraceae bacterium]
MMKRLLYIVWQYTWGLLQNLAGGTIYAFYRLRGCPHFAYQGALAVIWPVRSGSMSLGRFLFLHESYRPGDRALLAHEYGHTIQSLILGPLYLFVIGLPSLLWAGLPVFQRRRHDRHVSYYSFYPEKWANALGARFARPRRDPEARP